MREDEEQEESNKEEDDRRTYSTLNARVSSWAFPLAAAGFLSPGQIIDSLELWT